MFIVGLFSWWYSAGWRRQFTLLNERLAATYDYFSLDLLFRTLFSPFRQIAAGSVRGPIGVQLRAWFDQLISRVIGAVVRTMIIIVGSIGLFLTVCFGAFFLLFWAIIPLLPIVGVVAMVAKWGVS